MDIFSSINTYAFNFANSVASPLLTLIMNYWAESFVVVLLALLVYFYMKKDDELVPLLASMVILFVISELIKDIVKEPRPCSLGAYSWINHAACETGYGFPSSHATVLTGLFVFMKNYNYLRAAYVAWILVVLFGRVYLGEHYLTDVIAGAAISIVVCYIMYRLKDRINGFVDRYFGKIVNLKKFGVNLGNS